MAAQVKWDPAFVQEMYRRVFTIRRFEEGGERRYKRGEIIGSYHSCIGEEGSAVGAAMALEKTDYMTGTHRSHGHPIAKGAELRRLAAEILGKQAGVCKGKGGSMHVADFSVGSLGESGIVGAGMAIAVGAGLASKLRGDKRVALTFFGDGAANEGMFHEALNFASVRRLPVIFLCENNQYASSTWYRDTTSVEFNSKRAPGYSMPGITVDGQMAPEVYLAVKEAVDRARQGLGPSLVECMTYRYREHGLMQVFAGLPGKTVKSPYRSQWEMEQWQRRDPVDLLKSWILAMELIPKETLDALEKESEAKVEEAWVWAEGCPDTNPEEIWLDTWVEPVPESQRVELI